MFYRRLKSFVFAFQGIVDAVRTQVHMRVHIVLGAMALGGCAYFDVAPLEWVAVIGCIGLVVGLEMVNTALEYLVDWLSPEYNPLAGKVKDVAAGAVLVAAMCALAIGGIIFGPHLLAWLTN